MAHSKKHAWLEDLEDDDEGQQHQLQREWDSRREEFYNTGYREGLEVGKQQAVQDGFNAGGDMPKDILCSAPLVFCNTGSLSLQLT